MNKISFLIKFSYRNLWRSPRRTIIMLFSLAIGCAFIIWNLNFANSGTKEVMKEFLAQYAGQYHITHSKYYNSENPKEFNNFKTITDENILNKDIFAKSTRRVTAPVFVSGEKKTLGVLLTGLEIDREKQLSTLYKVVSAGRFLAENGEKEIILGNRLAKRININVGDTVAVIGQALDGSVANDLLTVVGFLDFGGGDLEESLAFTNIRTARDLMVMSPSQYHQRVSFDMKNESLPHLPGVAVTHWTEILPEIGVSIKFINQFTWTVSLVIVLVISLGLSNTIMITFFEREQEFQSLNIIGAKTSWVTLSLLIEIFMMGTVAVLAGAIIGHAFTTYYHYYPINLEMFTGGAPILLGGMIIKPLVKIYPVKDYYWQVPLMIYFFIGMTMIYPLIRVIRRSKNAI